MNNLENLATNIEQEMQLQKIKEEIIKKFSEYKKSMSFIASDAPIEVLCLPDIITKILLNNGLLRVYDLFDCNLTEIKGLGVVRIRQLTSRLDEFASMF